MQVVVTSGRGVSCNYYRFCCESF